jgi:hypothetical protein
MGPRRGHHISLFYSGDQVIPWDAQYKYFGIRFEAHRALTVEV